MAVLERNLEQLTIVQKQLIDQNAMLKKTNDLSERKIVNRNERINDLEKMLHELNNKMTEDRIRHDTEVDELRERLEQVQAVKTPTNTSFTFGEGRVAKPLRGGAANTATTSTPIRSPPGATIRLSGGSASVEAPASWLSLLRK